MERIIKEEEIVIKFLEKLAERILTDYRDEQKAVDPNFSDEDLCCHGFLGKIPAIKRGNPEFFMQSRGKTMYEENASSVSSKAEDEGLEMGR